MTHYPAKKESKKHIEPPIPARKHNKASHSFSSHHYSSIIPGVKHSAIATDISDKTLTLLKLQLLIPPIEIRHNSLSFKAQYSLIYLFFSENTNILFQHHYGQTPCVSHTVITNLFPICGPSFTKSVAVQLMYRTGMYLCACVPTCECTHLEIRIPETSLSFPSTYCC